MTRLMTATLVATLTLAITASLDAQIQMPPASPRVKIEQQIALSKISLDYGRPGVKGRKIVGGLLTYGQVWRTGANASTKITFDADSTFGGKDVPAGTYALYTIPNESKWTVILSKNTGNWGASGYDSDEDLLRVMIEVEKLADAQESLHIGFTNFHSAGADLCIDWEHTRVRIPIGVDSTDKILAEIKKKVIEAKETPDARTLLGAARFYHEQMIDLPQAEKWMDMAAEQSPDAFWITYASAELAHTMGKTDKARSRASQALQLAKAAEWDFGYIAKCQLLLDRLDAKTD